MNAPRRQRTGTVGADEARLVSRQQGSNPVRKLSHTGRAVDLQPHNSVQPVPRTPATAVLFELALFNQGAEVLLQGVPAGPC